MTATSCHVSSLLEKMTSPDKDFRFMATNDLISELQNKNIKLDDETEKKIVKMLLRLLEDKNGEVQNLTVKCLGPLVNRIKAGQTEVIVDTLCKNLTSEKSQLRDISSVALKTVIMEMPRNNVELLGIVCKKITGRLTTVVQSSEDAVVQLEALDILAYLLENFGSYLQVFHPAIRSALLLLLQSTRPAVRKRSITALSFLCAFCEQTFFNEIITILQENLDGTFVPTYIQAFAAIARQSGQRLGPIMDIIMPKIIDSARTQDDELKEYCLLAFEAFLRKAPIETNAYLLTISEISLEYLQHDPNYNYEDADDDVDMDDDGSNYESDDEYSDDDDVSWKVRRAAAKCLEAIISTRHDMLLELYKNIAPALIARYKEREENVKLDIFSAYIALLRQTKNCLSSSGTAQEGGNLDIQTQLQSQVPMIVKSLHKQLKERSVKTRQGCFDLLRELINALPGSLKGHISTLIPAILFSLEDSSSNSNMKIDALVFINCLLRTHPPEVFYSTLDILLPAVVATVKETFYKINSEGLVVIYNLIEVIRPQNRKPVDSFEQYVPTIYNCIMPNLTQSDLDQEVKEKAITCLGQFVSTFGDRLTSELTQMLPIVIDKLKNEITRLASIKALINITNSQHQIDFAPYLPQAVPDLASFLRKKQRILKVNTLILLNKLTTKYPQHLTHAEIKVMLVELPVLINEFDSYISQLTLELLTSLVNSGKAHHPLLSSKILPETLLLVHSPLLQGAALNSLLAFFRSLIVSKFPDLDFNSLVKQLTDPIYESDANVATIHKHAYHSIAKSVATVAVLNKNDAIATVNQLMTNIVNYKNKDVIQSFAFLAIGEIGKCIDLSSIENLKNLLVAALSSNSDEVKSSASFALGSVSVGNLQFYLPFVLHEIESRNKRQYLLLHSLKEIISCQSINVSMVQMLQPHLESIWNLLLNHCKCPEEGTRNVVAECLGKLINLDPEVLLPRLQAYLSNESPLARATVVTAIKFTISEQPQPIDALLRTNLCHFLRTIKDDDINVRRVALVAFNSAAHNKPILIRDLLPEFLPLLYKETNIRKELIREVEMGPFKHTVDDGLDIRKAAFECMYTLLDTCLDRIDIFAFLDYVQAGLNDHSDIKMLTYLMLIRLSNLCPSAVLSRCDKLVDPLRSVCISKLKNNAVKQEIEKLDELKRSAMRAFMALQKISDNEKVQQLAEFQKEINNTDELKNLFDQVQKDYIGSINDTSVPMEIN